MKQPWIKKIGAEIRQNPFNSTVGLLSLLGLGTLGGWLSHLINLGREWFLFVYLPTLVVGCFWYYHRQKYRIGRLSASGIKDFFPRYDPHYSSRTYWQKTTDTYRYLGITGATFRQDLKHFMNGGGQNLNYEFLFLDPQSNYLSQVERERLGLAVDDRSPAAQRALAEHVVSKQRELEATVAVIQTTIPNQKPGKVRLKVYDAYPAFWMEILDNEIILMGLLTAAIPGHQSPLLVLKNSAGFTFYHAARAQWDRLWEDARNYP